MKGQYDPCKVRTCLRCKKCGSTKRVVRHHKGHEFYFAVVAEEWYAKRYVEFRPEDCVELCRKCHRYVHNRVYEPIMDEFRTYLAANIEYEAGQVVWVFPPRFDVLESFRMQFVNRCNRWLERKNKKRRIVK